MRSAIAKPAASSAAVLIFLPDDKRSMASFNSTPEAASERWADKDPRFVLTTIGIVLTPMFLVNRQEVAVPFVKAAISFRYDI